MYDKTLDKKDFAGKWYSSAYSIDVSYENVRDFKRDYSNYSKVILRQWKDGEAIRKDIIKEVTI